MLGESTNGWAFGFHSLLDGTNFLPFLPSPQNDSKATSGHALVGFFIIFWTLLYLTYEKCLHLLLRRMCFPLTKRRRIINAAWSCGFCFGSICYLKLSASSAVSVSSLWEDAERLKLGVVLHRSFYFHRAGIEVFCRSSWLGGWTDLLFAMLFVNPYRQKCSLTITDLLFYKAIDTLIPDVCRVLLSVRQARQARTIVKLAFLLYCANWVYVYLYFVPSAILLPTLNEPKVTQPYLWMWLASECLNSTWLKLLGCINSSHWLETCLFPPPTQEAIELASIRKRQRESLKIKPLRSPKKTELWHTLLCSLAIKKKIQRFKEMKQNSTEKPPLPLDDEIESSSSSEDNNDENVEENLASDQ